MKFSDEMLMAYADGELDLVARAEIEAAMTTDPEIARAIERHRAIGANVRGAYQSVLKEPVPARLAALVSADEESTAELPVVQLADRRAAKELSTSVPRPWLPQWAAVAASLAIGLLIGLFVLREPAAPWEDTDAGLVARDELDYALTTQLAGGTDAPNVRVGISFRDRAGDYCRTFHLQREAPIAGLACRAGEAWRLQVLASAVKQEGELQPAAAMPMAVLQAVDAAIDGEPLDATAESAARDAGWR
jgi:hypothetical protein